MIAQPPAYGITESSQHFGYVGHELRVSKPIQQHRHKPSFLQLPNRKNGLSHDFNVSIRQQLHEQRVELVGQYCQQTSGLDARTLSVGPAFFNHASQQLTGECQVLHLPRTRQECHHRCTDGEVGEVPQLLNLSSGST